MTMFKTHENDPRFIEVFDDWFCEAITATEVKSILLDYLNKSDNPARYKLRWEPDSGEITMTQNPTL